MLFLYEGVEFTTSRVDHLEPSSNLQIAHLNLPKGHTVLPHHHIDLSPDINVSEIWIVLEGSAKVDVFTNKALSSSLIVAAGHVLLTTPGTGHSLTVLSNTFKMIEIKNGPYSPHLTEKI